MNLTTHYLGLPLRTPLVPAPSPLSENLDNLRRMEDAGAAAVVMHSLFEEQLRHADATLHRRRREAAEPDYFPAADEFSGGPEHYLENLVRARQALGIPIIASLNGTTFGGWTAFAREIERAGADALELNIYAIPTDPAVGAEEIELDYLTLLAALKAQLRIPIAVKLVSRS
jgi:dihydroorotate dehydrogenase (fumarate)